MSDKPDMPNPPARIWIAGWEHWATNPDGLARDDFKPVEYVRADLVPAPTREGEAG